MKGKSVFSNPWNFFAENLVKGNYNKNEAFYYNFALRNKEPII